MPTITAERREEKFAEMRERQQWLREAREAREAGLTPPPKPKRVVAPNAIPEFYRVRDIAEKLHVSRQTVKLWFESRAVKVPSKGGPVRRKVTLLIPRRVFEDWVREHT